MEPLAEAGTHDGLGPENLTLFAMELMPGHASQSMDASVPWRQSPVYKAVLLAANALPKLFPMLMTAAGTITPARVLVMGVGWRGSRPSHCAPLAPWVERYDVRPVVKEQVESLGARFVELKIESREAQECGRLRTLSRRLLQTPAGAPGTPRSEQRRGDYHCRGAGQAGSTLIAEEVVAGMRPGSVIVDLGAEKGGTARSRGPGKP